MQEPAEHRSAAATERQPRRGLPLYLQVLLGVFLGSLLGAVMETRPFFGNFGNEQLGQLGLLVIRLLKALAIPLILFAILDAFARTRIGGRAAGRLLLICLVNVSVAFTIGLTIMNVVQPGRAWLGRLEAMQGQVRASHHGDVFKPPTAPEGASLDLVRNISGYVPESLIDPFAENSVIPVVLLAVLAGAALRKVKERQEQAGEDSIRTVERFIEATYQLFVQMLEWVVRMVPWAVFGVVAAVVGRSGIEVFGILWVFLVTILAGLLLHSLVYYPTVAWLVGKKPPQVYLGQGADAIFTGLSTNSSLATVPVTLRCLTQKMGVSPPSARLAACVGTNLNNDGITLYEAMTALFLAQALGRNLSIPEQGVILLASIMAGAGVAGIPEAGLVVLPLVLSAAGLPTETIALAIPLIMPVDWILARARSGVNVLSDMLVAILLDRGLKPTAEEVPEGVCAELEPVPDAGA